MNISVLPYIKNDTDSVSQNTNNATNTIPVADNEKSFEQTLNDARRATAALAIDNLVKQSQSGSVDAQIVQNYFDTHGINIKINTGEVASAQTAPASSQNGSAYTASGQSLSVDSQTYDSNELNCSAELESIFQEAANTYGVDVKFLKSIAKCESDFNPNDVSRSGAVGIMQLMPATAAELGVNNSYDPYQNIMGGAKYISELLDRYNGDKSLALAAYNAGSGNVKKYGGIPPFKETQNYVKKVIGYYNS